MKKLYESSNINAIAEKIQEKTEDYLTKYTTTTMPEGIKAVYNKGYDKGEEAGVIAGTEAGKQLGIPMGENAARDKIKANLGGKAATPEDILFNKKAWVGGETGDPNAVITGAVPKLSELNAEGTPAFDNGDITLSSTTSSIDPWYFTTSSPICLKSNAENFGNASTDQVLSGTTFTSSNGLNVTGAMPNNGPVNKTFSGINASGVIDTSGVTIEKGYTEGGTVRLDNTISSIVDDQTDLINAILEQVEKLPGTNNSGAYQDGYNEALYQYAPIIDQARASADDYYYFNNTATLVADRGYAFKESVYGQVSGVDYREFVEIESIDPWSNPIQYTVVNHNKALSVVLYVEVREGYTGGLSAWSWTLRPGESRTYTYEAGIQVPQGDHYDWYLIRNGVRFLPFVYGD